jgi:hypothetical protein
MNSLIPSLYPRRIYTAKRIQELLDSHLNEEKNTTTKIKIYNIGISLIPDILS